MHLDVAENNITTIWDISYIPGALKFIMTRNPLNCNEDISWLLDVPSTWPRMSITLQPCATPPRLVDVLFTDMTIDYLRGKCIIYLNYLNA